MTKHNPYLSDSDPLAFIDQLVQQNEADTLEILENALWYLSGETEGNPTLSHEELLYRIRNAIAGSKGEELDKEVDWHIAERMP